MTEHVLVVGSGRDLPARVRRALPGTHTSVICRLDFVGKLRELAEHTRVIAVRHDAPDEEWIALARAAHELGPFTRIATFGERDQKRCAAIGEALGICTHSPRTIALVHDKHAMRVRLRETGVDTTASAVVADPAALAAFAAEHGFPCVVKPVSATGRAGVAVVRDVIELASAFERASARFDGLPDAGVLVEQFHEGPQFSVQAFSELGDHQVVAITRKFYDPTTFVELGHVAPAELTCQQQKEIQYYVEQVLDALDVTFGATHTEIVLSEDGPRVIETHVRMGGDEIPALALDATGVDLAECVVRQTVGEKVLPEIRAVLDEKRPARCSAIWFVAAPAAGVLADVSGIAEARRTEGVTEVNLLVDPGSTIGAVDSSDSHVAYVRALGETADQVVNTARKAAAHLEFDFVAQQRTVQLVSEQDCADVVATQDLILRNLKVTEAYYRLSIGMTLLTGHQDVSWLTFACHASKTVGTFIRGEAVPLARMVELSRRVAPSRRSANAVRARLSDAAAHAAELVSEGNIKVFAEIGPVMARMIAEFHDARKYDRAAFDQFLERLNLRTGPTAAGGQDTLREALVHYYDAMFQPDPERKAELMLLANFKVGLHEQIRLQPHIKGAMNAPMTRGLFEALGSRPLAAAAREPMMQAWRHFATRAIMRYRLPYGSVSVSGHLPILPTRRTHPDVLTNLDHPELRTVEDRYGTASGARWFQSRDWANLDQRMTFIFNLFRTRQKSLELFDPPFLHQQRLAIATDQLPTGLL